MRLRGVYLFLRQRYHHVCACAEELGKGGVDYNEFVTNLAAVDAGAGGQQDPRLQGRCIPHNLQTLKLGTSDGWISVDELGVAGQQGNKATGSPTEIAPMGTRRISTGVGSKSRYRRATTT